MNLQHLFRYAMEHPPLALQRIAHHALSYDGLDICATKGLPHNDEIFGHSQGSNKSTAQWSEGLRKYYRDCTSVYVDYPDPYPIADSILSVCWKETIVHYYDLPKFWRKLIRKAYRHVKRKERLRQIATSLQNAAGLPCYCSLHRKKRPYRGVSYILRWDIQRGDYGDLVLENQVKVKKFLVDAGSSISDLE